MRFEIAMGVNLRALLLSLGTLFLLGPVIATSDSQEMPGPMMGAGGSQQIQALKKEISALKAEVRALRKAVVSLQALKPTLTTLMPDFAERFHVMHRAGDAGDWALAAHELQGMQDILKVARQIDVKHEELMESFLGGNFRKLNDAIEHGSGEAFDKALKDTITSCNSCHVAVGSPFIKVTLDVDISKGLGLSLRHPHALGKSKAPTKHSHKR